MKEQYLSDYMTWWADVTKRLGSRGVEEQEATLAQAKFRN